MKRRPWPWTLRVGAASLLGLALLALAAPWLAPHDPNRQFDPFGGRWRPPGTTLWRLELQGGREWLADRVERQGEHLLVQRFERVDQVPVAELLNVAEGNLGEPVFFAFGTDQLGRDVLSRWLFATRISLSICFFSLLISSTLGILIGTLAAYSSRWLDLVVMRLLEAFIAFPWIILLITLATFYNTGPSTLVWVLGLTGWMGTARLARVEARGLKAKEFVLVARMLGVPGWKIFFRHILPNISPPLLVDATIKAGQLVMAEAAISFLGLGVLPPQPSWGNMIADGRDLSTSGWWLIAIPTVSLVAMALAVQWTSDALRNVLDPRWLYPADDDPSS